MQQIARYNSRSVFNYVLSRLGIALAVWPIVWTIYELITTRQDSVIFLDNFAPWIQISVLLYYLVLFLFGLRWLFRRILDIVTLRNERTKNELLHLQNQVNPHFFFNMLNNLYGLVAVDAQKAQELILKLSDMMRYSIYDGQKKQVTLSEEIAYLKNFIELNKMRYHKKIDVHFDLQIEYERHQIMPLLFIILLENAFKHGVEKLRENAYVHVHMATEENSIYFSVENNFDPNEPSAASGIGLNNLKRRLELVYPNKHSLSFSTTGGIYKAQLMLTQL